TSRSSVRLPAKLTLASVMVWPLPVAWPGGLPCPWNRGRWTPWHATRPPGASGRANEVGHESRCRPSVGSGAGLVGGALAAGVGHASTVRADPPTLGVVGERGSHHERCSQLGSGRPSSC